MESMVAKNESRERLRLKMEAKYGPTDQVRRAQAQAYLARILATPPYDPRPSITKEDFEELNSILSE